MEMRQRRTFKEVTADIMANVSAFLEAMAAPPPRAEPKGKATRRELDTTVADPPPPPPPKKFKGEKGKKGRKGEGKGKKGGGQKKGADKRPDGQWTWSSAHDWSSGSGGRGQAQKQGGKRQGQWQGQWR